MFNLFLYPISRKTIRINTNLTAKVWMRGYRRDAARR